jgi:hypothetical protein
MDVTMCSNTFSLLGGTPSLALPSANRFGTGAGGEALLCVWRRSTSAHLEERGTFSRADVKPRFAAPAKKPADVKSCQKTPMSHYYVPVIIVWRETDRRNRIINSTQTIESQL